MKVEIKKVRLNTKIISLNIYDVSKAALIKNGIVDIKSFIESNRYYLWNVPKVGRKSVYYIEKLIIDSSIKIPEAYFFRDKIRKTKKRMEEKRVSLFSHNSKILKKKICCFKGVTAEEIIILNCFKIITIKDYYERKSLVCNMIKLKNVISLIEKHMASVYKKKSVGV